MKHSEIKGQGRIFLMKRFINIDIQSTLVLTKEKFTKWGMQFVNKK